MGTSGVNNNPMDNRVGFQIGVDNKPFEDGLKFISEQEIVKTIVDKQLGEPGKVILGLLGRK